MKPTIYRGRLVDLVNGLGILVEGLRLASHTAQVIAEVNAKAVTCRAFQLDEDRALLVGGQLGAGEDDGELVDVNIVDMTSTGRRERELRGRLAELLLLPENHLQNWTDREVRHALLYVVEATSVALRDKRLVAIEAALGQRTTI